MARPYRSFPFFEIATPPMALSLYASLSNRLSSLGVLRDWADSSPVMNRADINTNTFFMFMVQLVDAFAQAYMMFSPTLIPKPMASLVFP